MDEKKLFAQAHEIHKKIKNLSSHKKIVKKAGQEREIYFLPSEKEEEFLNYAIELENLQKEFGRDIKLLKAPEIYSNVEYGTYFINTAYSKRSYTPAEYRKLCLLSCKKDEALAENHLDNLFSKYADIKRFIFRYESEDFRINLRIKGKENVIRKSLTLDGIYIVGDCSIYEAPPKKSKKSFEKDHPELIPIETPFLPRHYIELKK